MKTKLLFVIATAGILAGVVSVFLYNEKITPQPPVAVSYNPYASGIYASGIVESYQPTGSDTNIYSEVSGKVVHIFVKEGQTVTRGMPILAIDDSVQRALVAKDAADIQYQQASLVNVQEQLNKIKKSYHLDPQSVSKNNLDNAINAVKMTRQSLNAALGQYLSDRALLNKFIIKAPIDGVILRIATAVGNYVSPNGSYDTYTESMLPTVQMGVVTPYLQVRCYIDEILVPKLPAPDQLEAKMFIRGLNNFSIPLEFVSVQPMTIPNIELSDAKQERVDVRVLPIIFKFTKPADVNIYPGQLVDVYIKGAS
jgi:HlyD family secretion protein